MTQPITPGSLVLVTGASGYLATALIDLLVREGHRVRGTVRDLKADKVTHVKQFPDVELFEADLTVDGSFDKAVNGVECVFHTASPFLSSFKDATKELVEPALNGTINVLKSAFNNNQTNGHTIKRIVLTSSVATVRRPELEKDSYHVSTEQDWNDFAQVSNLPYPYSKVVAERKAWEMVEEYNKSNPLHPVELITILPSWILGPVIGTRVDGVSVGTIVNWLNEDPQTLEKGVRNQQVGCVDVRDVAQAHLEAARRQGVSGRYIVSLEKAVDPLDQIEMFKQQFPNKKFATKHVGPLNPSYGVDNSRARNDLGINFRPLEETMKDMANSLVKLGMISA
jgi:nucleoside-diphosphate-sugar epimerase